MTKYYYYYYYTRLVAFFPKQPTGKSAPEKHNHSGKTNLDLLEQEIVSGSASAGRYANLHLTPDR